MSRFFVQLLLFGLVVALGATELRAIAPAADLQQQEEELTKIRRSDQRFFDLRGRVAKLWDGSPKEIQAKILALPRNEKTKANVFLAVGLALSEREQHSVVDAYLDALGKQRYDAATLANVSDAVVASFHAKKSVFDLLDAALLRHRERPKGLVALCAVYPRLVNGNRDGNSRDADVERHEACRRLVALWRGELAAGGPTIADALTQLVQTAHRGDDPATWSDWLQSVGAGEDPPRLAIDEALRQALDATRRQLDDIRKERRDEVRRLIGLMREAGQPPVDFLVKDDADVRKTALVAIQGLAEELPEAARQAARTALLDRAEALIATRALAAPRLGDVLAGVTALFRGASEKDRTRLLALATGPVEGSDDPGFFTRRLEAVRVAGLPLDDKALAEFYRATREGDRAHDRGWVQVRVKLVEASVVGEGGAEAVLAMIEDPNEKVRGAAAAACVRLVDRFARAESNPIGKVASRLTREKDAVTRRRLLEAFRALLRANGARLDAASVDAVLGALVHEDLATRRLAAAAARDLHDQEGADDARRDAVRTALTKALANGGGDELKAATARAFAGSGDEALRGVVLDWLLNGDAPPAAALVLRSELIASFGKAADAIWVTAERFAAKKGAGAQGWAAAFGERALALAEAEPPAPFKVDVAAAKTGLLRWWERSGEAAHQELALKRLDALLKDSPRDGARLRRRTTLLERVLLRTRDEARRGALRQRLSADLRAQLDPATTKIDDGGRLRARRRLARLEYEAGRSAEVAKLLRAIATPTPGDRALLALAVLLDPRADARETLTLLAGLPAAPAIWDDAARARVEAVARVRRAETLDLGRARALVSSWPKDFKPRQAFLEELVEDEALAARLNVIPNGEAERKVLATELAQRAEASRRILVGLLITEGLDPKHRAALDALLRQVVGKDEALSAIKVPAEADATAKAYRAGLEAWHRAARKGQKSPRPFLNGL